MEKINSVQGRAPLPFGWTPADEESSDEVGSKATGSTLADEKSSDEVGSKVFDVVATLKELTYESNRLDHVDNKVEERVKGYKRLAKELVLETTEKFDEYLTKKKRPSQIETADFEAIKRTRHALAKVHLATSRAIDAIDTQFGRQSEPNAKLFSKGYDLRSSSKEDKRPSRKRTVQTESTDEMFAEAHALWESSEEDKRPSRKRNLANSNNEPSRARSTPLRVMGRFLKRKG